MKEYRMMISTLIDMEVMNTRYDREKTHLTFKSGTNIEATSFL